MNGIRKKGAWCWTEGNGDTYWYRIGKDGFHRDDGPAIEYANGKTEYWIDDKHIPELDNKRIYGKKELAKYLLLV